MVCKACEKRSRAPKKFSAKVLAKSISPALREARVPKTRFVYTSCMGLCPKKAIAVATPAADGSVTLIAWRKSDDPTAGVAVLFPQAALAQKVVAQAVPTQAVLARTED